MITDMLKRLLVRIGWFVPGFLLWAAFPPMGEVADSLFALAPLMWLSRRAAPGESAKRWFQCWTIRASPPSLKKQKSFRPRA